MPTAPRAQHVIVNGRSDMSPTSAPATRLTSAASVLRQPLRRGTTRLDLLDVEQIAVALGSTLGAVVRRYERG
jgi:hypothetical protein